MASGTPPGASAMRANGRKQAARLGRSKSGRFVRSNLKIGFKRNRRRNSGYAAIAVRQNGLATRLSGIAVKLNPFRGSFRGNPLSIATPANLIRRIPLVGPIVAPLVVPAIVGIVSIAAVHYALEYGMPLIAGYAPAFVTETILPMIEPIGYTAAGAIVGGAIGILPIPFVSAKTRGMIAVGAVVAGAAIDTIRWLGAGADSVNGLGGGLYQVVNYQGIATGGQVYGDADTKAVLDQYLDAKPGDATRCASDMTPNEAAAAAAGARTWRNCFPPVRTLVRQGNSATSTHAGREGGQWGWCQRMIGWDAFQKLATLSPEKRREYIATLRGQAIALLQQPQFSGLVLAQ